MDDQYANSSLQMQVFGWKDAPGIEANQESRLIFIMIIPKKAWFVIPPDAELLSLRLCPLRNSVNPARAHARQPKTRGQKSNGGQTVH